jgi:Ser/Thr protein kinase RdoA (MazF antagonist)
LESALKNEQLIERIEALASTALYLWALPAGATARLINISENATFLVEAPGGHKSILRVHRQNYHTQNAISCELAWMAALAQEGGIVTPGVVPGINGKPIQEHGIEGLPGTRYLVMFEFVDGEEPSATENLAPSFEELGEIAARSHVHSIAWKKPANFERLVWNTETVFGDNATWGDWRNAPNMDATAGAVMQRLQDVVTRRLEKYGVDSDRYGLIHADMRLANLLINEGSTRLIDFDDCGSGWFMYDFAAGISFMEDHPQVPALKRAWVTGYRKVRGLSEQDEREMDTFVMLRRLALCAWIGSHGEVDIARELSPVFVPVTVELAERYLSGFS